MNRNFPAIKITSAFLAALLMLTFRSSIAFSAGNTMQTPYTNWDLTAEVGSWTTFENPHADSCSNPDVWQFMISNGLIQDPQTYVMASYFTPNYAGLDMWAWTKTEGAGWPVIRYNPSNNTYSGVSLPHTFEVHPENNQMDVIAWKSPISGNVSITGSVADAHYAGGDGVQWFINKNSSNLAYGSYGDGGSQDFTNGVNGGNLSSVSVSTNDVIYLIVHPNQNDGTDTTRVNLFINVVNPPIQTPTGTPFTCNNWNLANDFNVSPSQANPDGDSCNNPSVWSYMESADLTRDPAGYTLLPNFTDSGMMGNPTFGLNYWQGTYTDPWGTYPFIGYNATSITQIPGFPIWPPDTIALHPAPSRMPVIGWRSPLNGFVSIAGSIIDAHTGCGNGVSWYIDRNTVNLASGSVNDNSQAFSSGVGGASLALVSVNVNDMIYLVIDPNLHIGCDMTRVDLSINVTTPPASTPTPTNTATYTPTFTATSTPTLTFTPSNTPTITFTPSNTPTLTTHTPVPGTPQSNGSGPCWFSETSWATYTVDYAIDRSTIPTSLGWDTFLYSAAQTWNDVTPSPFQFIYESYSVNTIRLEEPNDNTTVAVAAPPPSGGFITSGYIKINPLKDFDTNNTPLPNNPDSNGEPTFNIQNVVTHEFGHWLYLGNVTDPNCTHVTMRGGVMPGEIKKISLETEDKNGLNWQYP